MPPFLPRKRLRSPSPTAGSVKIQSTSKGKGVASTSPRKVGLFDASDANTSTRQSAEKTRNLLARLGESDPDESDLSSFSSEPEFEDVPKPKRQKFREVATSDENEDEEVEFEDIQTYTVSHSAITLPSGDLDLTLTKETRNSLVNSHNKKHGPSKIERQIRISTHCMHIQFLLWHNWLRNRWMCDEEVQQTLLRQLGPNIRREVQKWREATGVLPGGSAEQTLKSERGSKGKRVNERSQRDWGEPAQRIAVEGNNMSHGDPLIKLVRALSAYWKKRFRITAPSLRKLGYMSLPVLDEELKSFSKNHHDKERHGERIRNIEELRNYAKVCEGSRDLSAQLFTALLRGIGFEARMVVSLQPVGFGWSKHEEAAARPSDCLVNEAKAERSAGSGDGDQENEHQAAALQPKGKEKSKQKAHATISARTIKTRHGSRVDGVKTAPIDLSEFEDNATLLDSDNESVIDITPALPRGGLSKIYEKDLPPNYWIEILSPTTNTYHVVNPLNTNDPVAMNPNLLAAFEPRGAKSEKAKQVMAYVVGFSADGTAKDVTIRYLKRHMWPGKTKGYRMPIEKVPVYDRWGKKWHEEFDWFKTAIRRYERDRNARTDVDDREEATDLKAIRPEKKEAKEGEETLQSYKSSADFVLERHLRREEALLPIAQHVKMFVVKGKKGEAETEEKVFLRKDVVSCKSMETWHKEGRAPILGAQPLKRVPYRAATTNRKRELAEAEAASGEKMLQGLYSWDQTDWIIPPPILDGVIPKNGYGNMDVFVPSMVPEGAVHIPRRRTKEICRKLGIDYAEAVTGFEFGARMAIPVITGVVIAEEHKELILEQWNRDEAERARKEDEKRTKAALSMWRRFLMGLRIVERVREEYGDEIDDNPDVINPWTNKKFNGKILEKHVEGTRRQTLVDEDYGMPGGFSVSGDVEDEPARGFFPTRHENDDDDGGGFIVEHDEPRVIHQTKSSAYVTPASIIINKRSQVDIHDSVEKEREGSNITRNNAKSANNNKTLVARETQKRTSRMPVKVEAVAGHFTDSKSRLSKSRNRYKQPTPSEDDEESMTSDSPLLSHADGSDLESEPEVQARRRRPNRKSHSALPRNISAPANNSQRAVPKRQAARKSETAVRSHYFVNDVDDENMELDG